MEITEKEFKDKYYMEVKGQTIDTLLAFIKEMMDEELGYGSVCCAVAASAVAAAWVADGQPNGGITGFQASCVMWEFIRQWSYSSNKCGLRIVDYDNLLYPQHKDDFTKTITKKCWDGVQKEAREKLAEGVGVEAVKAHWQNIVNGVVPFGFKVKED